MKYITGIHALNLPCSLDTCGDWHQSAIQWESPTFADSDLSVYGEYGIEFDIKIPLHQERFAVANHIRALLDLLVASRFSLAQGMNKDFICNESYDSEIFNKVLFLRDMENWKLVDAFMGKEYLGKWLNFKKGVSI